MRVRGETVTADVGIQPRRPRGKIQRTPAPCSAASGRSSTPWRLSAATIFAQTSPLTWPWRFFFGNVQLSPPISRRCTAMLRACGCILCVIGTVLAQAYINGGYAQSPQPQMFVPGEIIIVYNSAKDRADARKELGKLGLHGQRLAAVHMQPAGDTACRVPGGRKRWEGR
jgi:hypothetical protein